MMNITRTGAFILLSMFPALAGAQSILVAQTAEQPLLDVVVVVDNSGSMKNNDPDALMAEAVAEFASKLNPESRMAVVIFDQSTRLAMELTESRVADFEAQIAEGLRGVNYGGQWTDIPGGVERAIYELRESGRQNAERAVILITDGVVETGDPIKDAERSRWLETSLASQAQQLGIRVFGIAFTEGADFRLLQSVAQTTGGEHYRVLDPAGIGGVFERVPSSIREFMAAEERRALEEAATENAVEPIVIERVVTPADPENELPWFWIVSGALGAGLLALVIGFIRARPDVTGTLHDIGGYTDQEVYSLRRRATRIGRDPSKNDLAIHQDTVSSQHARIEIRENTFYLVDLRSGNGTFINGKQMSDPESIREAALKHGDRIRFDAFEFEFLIDGVAAAPAADSGAPVTPGGTRLRVEASDLAVAATPLVTPASMSDEAAGIGETRLKTGKCSVHTAWKAIAVCTRCGNEKCAQCIKNVDGDDICIDCATATTR